MQFLYVLGRQPALGLAELESLCGAEAVQSFGDQCALVSSEAPVNFDRLGGSTKQASVLLEVPSTDWKRIEKELLALVRSSAFTLPSSGKFHLGLSAIGIRLTPAKLGALGLTLKKIVRSRHDSSVRLVPNNSLELSTAQVYHSHLADEHGAELLIATDGQKTVIARTIAVQDIDSYTLRDRGRPMRDARVGMLPPKLAQIIVNLASSQHASRSEVLLDPFCGTGVTLQEALLMGYSTYGTDLEPRMVTYSRENIDWLTGKYELSIDQSCTIEEGDATLYTWSQPIHVVAGETYLGLPFTKMPDHRTLEQNVSDVNTILRKFLANLRPQLTTGTRLCLAVPAWQTRPHAFRHLPLVDSLEEIGYNRVEFERVSSQDLIYYRDDQIVARQLLVLTVT